MVVTLPKKEYLYVVRGYANVARERTNTTKQPATHQQNNTTLIQIFKESQQAMRDMFQAVFEKQNQMLHALIQQNGI